MFKTDGLQRPKSKAGLAFLLALLCSSIIFIFFMVQDQGYFLFYGDFNVQQVPFYQHAHEAVRSGNWFWDFKTDLGANFIGSYSFYLLGSPFFWLTIPFPTSFVPYLIGPLLILKFSCASLTAYLYLSRFIQNKNYAVIGGLLYAFSGFSVYNIFFNHFHEAIVFFPLLLLSLEMLMVENRRGFFLFMVCICAVANYFFFVGMVVFTLIYYILRAVSGAWNVSFGKFGIVALEAVLGCLLGAVILLPSFYSVIQNSRVSSLLTGWGGLLYGKEQIYAYILQSFFFPPELPARPVFFTGADVKWSSVAGWLPVFGMTGVIAYLQGKKGTWLRRIICIMALMAFIPILNSSFYMFNYAYYARWFYMPVLMMCLATAHSFEDDTINWKSGWKWAFGITVAIVLAVGFFPTGMAGGEFTGYGLYDKNGAERFWLYCGIAILCLIAAFFLFLLKKKSVRLFCRTAIAAVCIVSCLYSIYFISAGKANSYNTNDFIIPNLLKGVDQIRLDGKATKDIDSRIDVYEGMDNTAMFLNMSSIQAFHSIVPASIMDFYEYIGVERTVGSRPDVTNYPIRALLSVQYLFDYAGDNNHFVDDNGLTKMPGWVLHSKQDGYNIYENEYYIPYGFTYDHYVAKSDVDEYSDLKRQQVMLKAIVLTDEQIAKYGDILTDINDPNTQPAEGEQVPIALYTQNEYLKDCERRRNSAASSFIKDAHGFTSTILTEKDNLVFYSIPYDEGWSATVDGEPVEIEKVNIGFMAVKVEGGKQHTIRFEYETPGLSMGIKITILSAVAIAVYLIVCFFVLRRKQTPGPDGPENGSPLPYGPLPGGPAPDQPADPSSYPSPPQASPGPSIQPTTYSIDDFQPRFVSVESPPEPQQTQPTDEKAPPSSDVIEDFDPDKFQVFLDQIAHNAEQEANEKDQED